MFFARSKGLFDLLLPHYGPTAMGQVQDVFNLMGLPMPDMAEYRDTTDVGALVLLNPYGCTVRVTNRQKLLSETILHHPRFLHPLGTFPNTTLKIDIYPGIAPLKPTVIAPDKELFGDFEKCGLEAFDAKPSNCGTLDNGYTVLLDIPSVQKIYEFIDDESISVPEDTLQKETYQHLREAFTKAVTTRNFDSFWDLCAAEHSRGLLKSSWMTAASDSMVDVPAIAYERRLMQNRNIAQHPHSAHFQGYNLAAHVLDHEQTGYPA